MIKSIDEENPPHIDKISMEEKRNENAGNP